MPEKSNNYPAVSSVYFWLLSVIVIGLNCFFLYLVWNIASVHFWMITQNNLEDAIVPYTLSDEVFIGGLTEKEIVNELHNAYSEASKRVVIIKCGITDECFGPSFIKKIKTLNDSNTKIKTLNDSNTKIDVSVIMSHEEYKTLQEKKAYNDLIELERKNLIDILLIQKRPQGDFIIVDDGTILTYFKPKDVKKDIPFIMTIGSDPILSDYVKTINKEVDSIISDFNYQGHYFQQ